MREKELDIIRYHEFIKGLKPIDAIQLLINIQAFDNEEELSCVLSKHKSLSEIILNLADRELHHPYTEDTLIRYNFLEELLFKSAQGLLLGAKHPEVLAFECTCLYEFSEIAETYCAYRLMHDKVEELLKTCQFYNICTLESLSNDVLETWIRQYLSFVQQSVEANDIDQKIIQQLQTQFLDVPKVVSYGKAATKEIDFIQLCKQIEEIDMQQNDSYYDSVCQQFLSEREFIDSKKGLSGMFIIPQDIIDRQEMLYNYVRNAELDEKMRVDLLDRTSDPFAFVYCMQIFEKLGMLENFNFYHSMVIKVTAAGWCVEHGYRFDDKEIDITYVI